MDDFERTPMEEQQGEQDGSEYFPKWLSESILRDDFPWEDTKSYRVQEFLEKYTLHDSLWICIHHDVAFANCVTLIIMWDGFWLPKELTNNTELVNDWPILLIKLEGVQQISTLGYGDMTDMQRGISTVEFTEIDGKNIFAIFDHYGGSVEITFDGTSYFLALNPEKVPLKI